MKILVATDPEIEVPPVLYGGAERVAHNLIRGLQNRQHDIVLLANPNSRPGQKVVLLPWKALSSVGWKNIWKNAWQLYRVIKQEDPDIVVCFARIMYLYPSWLLTNKLFIKRYGRLISRKSNALANAVLGKRIHYTPNARHMIAHLPKKNKYTPIYNGVDMSFYDDDFQVQRSHFLFLGRIESIKGVKEAVEASLLAGAKLLIAGNVPPGHRDYFNAYIQPWLEDEKIVYTGPVDNEQKRALLQQSLALLQPFNLHAEAFPSTALEALACGTPVIGFPIPALREAIIPGENGFLPADVPSMAAYMEKASGLDRKKIRADALRRFSIESTTERYLELINGLLENKKRT